MSQHNQIGELLVRKNLLNIEQLEAAKKEQRASGESMTSVISKLGIINEAEMIEFLSDHYNVPAVSIEGFEIEREALDALPKEVCFKHKVFPVSKAGNTLVVAFADPSNIFVKDDLQYVSRCRVEVVVASEASIMRSIEKYYNKSKSSDLGVVLEQYQDENSNQGGQEDLQNRLGDDSSSPVIKFVNMILSEAIKTKTSDIHIEPYESSLRIRFRKDGNLVEKIQPPRQMREAITTRLKIMANLDIAEKRKPQDGRIRVKSEGGAMIDFRVSVLPVVHGEKVVMRILDKSNLKLNLADLGFDQRDLDIFKNIIKQPQGMVLVTGPTGSGKTTTLYSALSEVNDPKKNLSTAEDPVEFNLEGINQVNMNPKAGLTFAAALRSFLRQDPDIILVGEIRDHETAEVAFKAASTGHLVLSTLHTNDAPSTVVRLLNMGVPGFLVTSAVSVIMAQRLVGTNCPKCKVEVRVEPELLIQLGANPTELQDYKVMKGEGCPECNQSGKKGRTAIYEVMTMSDAIRESILKGGTPLEIKAAAIRGGMRTLRQAALSKLKAGITNIDEVISKTIADEEV